MLCYLLTLSTFWTFVKRRFYHIEQDLILLPEISLGRDEEFDHIAKWNVSWLCCKARLSSNLHQIFLFLLSIWTNLSAAYRILEAWKIVFGWFALFSSIDVKNYFDTFMGLFRLYRKSAVPLALHNIHFALKRGHLYTCEKLKNLYLFSSCSTNDYSQIYRSVDSDVRTLYKSWNFAQYMCMWSISCYLPILSQYLFK